MVEKIKLAVKPREEKTPNLLRREGNIPATLYGAGKDPESVQLDAREFSRLPAAAYTHMIELDHSGKKTNAIIREVQRRSTTHQVLNVEFYRVSMDKKLTMSVPLKFVGVSPAVTAGGQLIENFQEAEVECLPSDIPENIEVDLSALKEIEDSIHFENLKPPANVEILNPPDEVVVKVV
ncbi:MAG TPA: 50S ribosomal protein L25, partial [Chroococcales cyanobacterium]